MDKRISGAKYPVICEFSAAEDPSCAVMPRHVRHKIAHPPNSCEVMPCKECVTGSQTFILDSSYNLLSPSSFILRQSNKSSTSSSAYTCARVNSKSGCYCDESEGCTGSTKFCELVQCTNHSRCHCHFTQKQSELIFTSEDTHIINPTMITFEVCLFHKRQQNFKFNLHRKLLEKEEAIFTYRNLTMSYKDPVLTLPDVGRVIVRNDELEHVFSVPTDLMITLPFEFISFKTTLQIIYIHPHGQTVTGVIHVTGKTICQLRQCFLCRDFYKHLKCLPVFVQYSFYSISIFLFILSVWLLRTVLKSLVYLFKFIFLMLVSIFAFAKLVARYSLLLGAYVGFSFRRIIVNSLNFLEGQADQGVQLPRLQLVLVALVLLASNANADCSSHSIVQSELKACQTSNDGTKSCKVYTTSELSLAAISSETCLWFTDQQERHLFTLKLKLDSVVCKFHTSRMYFTFPVKAKHISQISCIFNKYCGRGVHCQKRKIGKGGIHFEAETAESRDFPGISSCQPGGIGVGCTILTRASCNFVRTWYEPDLLYSYEVSKITSHTCNYVISVTHIENNTITQVQVSDTAYTKNGIRITVLGAYDQPQLHLTDFLIQRVGKPSEAYLAPASEKNHPRAGEIGAVQANTSYTTQFIFDPNLSSCDFFEDALRCTTAPDALTSLRSTQEHAIPLERDLHLFNIQEGALTSNLLVSSAVRLQLHFADFKVAIETTTVCPQFDEGAFDTTGCYNCPLLARLTFRAHSSCQAGVVTLHFQELSIHTKAIRLTSEPADYTVKFAAEKKCFTEKLCLRAQSLVQCKTFKICLQEPTIELLQLDTNYTNVLASSTSSTGFDWFRIPGLDTSVIFLKFIGSTLFIICISITIVSTFITCCCRTR